VPIDVDDPIKRMNAIRELVERQRNEPALSLTDPIAGVLNRLPTTATTSIFGAMLKGIDFVTSNVPGAPLTVFLATGKVEAHFAFGPMTGAAANITLLSYVDDVNLGINTDPAAIPDPAVFVDCLRDSFGEIAKLV
jgi:diacylglycerol O-acyltransferase / wax synthase